MNLPRPVASTAAIRVPWAIQACAMACFLLFAGYVGTYLVVRELDASLAASMLRLFGLTVLAGRETALFDAQHNGMPLPWALGFSYVDDIASLLLCITVFWFLLDALHRAPMARRMLARLEKQALRHRSWIQKWGLWGLAFFYFLPGFGSGVAVASAMGVLARIRVARLAVVLGAAVLLVDTFWALILLGPAHAIPHGGWFDWIPLAAIALVALAAAYGVWRDRGHRHLVLLDWNPHSGQRHQAALGSWGIHVRDGLVEADLRRVEAVTGVDHRHSLFAVEVLLLSGMTPEVAARLLDQGVTGIRDVARLPSEALAWMAQLPEAQANVASSWRGQAMAMTALSGQAWRE